MDNTKVLIDAITSARDAFLIYAKSAEGHHATKYELANDLRIQAELIDAELIDAALASQGEAPQRYRIEHDGFVGTKIGEYRRRDGKRGVVLQQDGTNIVHVYGEKWLVPVEGEAAQPAAGWRDMSSAPKDGTWILLRGRNAIGRLMIPVVAAWMPVGSRHQGWADSGSFKPVDNLANDVGADWMPLPSPNGIASQEKGSGE